MVGTDYFTSKSYFNKKEYPQYEKEKKNWNKENRTMDGVTTGNVVLKNND